MAELGGLVGCRAGQGRAGQGVILARDLSLVSGLCPLVSVLWSLSRVRRFLPSSPGLVKPIQVQVNDGRGLCNH